MDRGRAGGGPGVTAALVESMAGRQEEARRRFAESGFPTTRQEAWRFTDISPIAKARFIAAPEGKLTAGAIAPYAFGNDEGIRITFVNGRPSLPLSRSQGRPTGMVVLPLSEALKYPAHAARIERHLGTLDDEANPFVNWNTGHATEGAYIYVPRGVQVKPTVHLLFVTAPGAAGALMQPRNLIIVEDGARATVVEHFAGLEEGAYLVNPVTEAVIGRNAELTHYKVQREGLAGWHVGAIAVRQERDSRYHGFSAATGGRIARTDIRTVFAGPGGESTLNGLYLVRGDQLIDHHTRIEHREPNCASRELYKGVLDGRGHAVFNGQVYVTPEAQKTDGKQTNRNLVLSDGAKVDTKPELEIFADDVKCTHGATVGRLERLPLFYLESRGIGAQLATRMLTFAFAAEVLADLKVAPVRAQLESLLTAWLE